MPGAEKLKEKILSDARKTADASRASARREAEEILAKAREDAQAAHDELVRKAEFEAGENEKRMLSNAHIEGRMTRLAGKQRIIDEVFEKAVKSLCDKPDGEYEALLARMIADSASGREQLILSGYDKKRISAGFVDGVNAALAAKGKQAGLTLSEDERPIEGGFVLLDGQVEINNSFKSIVKANKDGLELAAVKMLFR